MLDGPVRHRSTGTLFVSTSRVLHGWSSTDLDPESIRL